MVVTTGDATAFPATKFTAPRATSEPWHRSVVERLFDGLSDRPIVVVQGLPGSARRALVTQWLAGQAPVAPRRGHPIAWLSCEDADTDPQRLWRALAVTVSRALESEHPLGDGGLHSPEQAADWVVDVIARSDRRLTIVVDEAHRAGVSIATLRPLLSWMPVGARVVFITSRSLPLAHHDLRARHAVHVLGPSDLSLQPEELTVVLSTRGMRLEPAIARELHAYSGGWLFAASTMAATVNRGAGPRTSTLQSLPAELSTLIREEVLGDVDDATVMLLADLALLDSFTDVDARSVLGDARTDEVLQVAESRCCVSDDGRGVWRLHPTIALHLVTERLDLAPDHLADVHSRAAAHFRERGRLRDAVRHRLAAGDLTSAIDDVTGMTYGGVCQEPAAGWTAVIDPVIHRSDVSPLSIAKYALALAVSGRHHAARTMLRTLGDRSGASEDIRPYSTATHLLARMAVGDVAEARALTDQLADPTEPWSIPPLVMGAMIEVCTWTDDNAAARSLTVIAELDTDYRSDDLLTVAAAYANNAAMAGHLREAERLASITLESAEPRGLDDHASLLGAHRALAQVEYQRSDLRAAGHRFATILERLGEDCPTVALLSRVGLAQVHMAAGRLGHAEDEIDRIPTLLVDRRPSPLMDHVLAAETQLAVAKGDLQRANQLVGRMQTPWRRSMWHRRISVHGPSKGQDSRDDGSVYPATPRVRLDRAVLRAAVAMRHRDRDAVDRHLRVAVGLAIDDDAVSPFFEYGLNLWPALHGVLREWPHRRFHDRAERRAEMLMSATSTTSEPRVHSRLEDLLPREREVLDLLLQGQSTRAIASALFISPNTVKTHVRAVYGKLGVHSRGELQTFVARISGE